MANKSVVWACALVAAAGCSGPADDSADTKIAEALLDAFYAWDRDGLVRLLRPGDDADRLLYYQGWAEAAHYRVQTRRPCRSDAGDVVCAVTVTDDFGSALGYTATDTFTMTVGDDVITGISFQGDDPPVFEAMSAWLVATKPEVFAGPCYGMFDGGRTPGDCARAVARGAQEFAAQRSGTIE